ncbi:hypothetical protein [Sagittula salina]|uniref:Uncharacterized protein n=1 Tax=Sagittula salina TaxID=2820268 RepID=A0A940MS48_9RHOB|nr:hypothetical protein [Sagittula salina]MBP0483683.1 hypothetical protein [Sagittula salina]
MFRILAAIGLIAAPAAAQEGLAPTVMDCDWQSSAQFVAEPWEANTRTFANGRTRLALIDTVEPVGGWAWLMILSPPHDELGFRQCRMVGNNGMGFSRLDFDMLSADYDPARGLIFDVPAGWYMDGTDDDPWQWIRITLNQLTGDIAIEVPH